MKIFMISLLLIAMINCDDEYEDCLNKYAAPKAKEIVQNFKNHQSSKNLDIVYNICRQQFICVFSKINSSIEYVKDYMYKDIYVKIFQTVNDSELSMIINYYWRQKDTDKTENLCYTLLGDNFDCKGLVNSFLDYTNRKFS